MSEDIYNIEIQPDKDGNYNWQCFVCGAILVQKEKPDFCPFCSKEETYFIKIQTRQ